MEKLKIVFKHKFSRDAAQQKVQNMIAGVQGDLAPKTDPAKEWKEHRRAFTLPIMGSSIPGNAFVEPSAVELTVEAPRYAWHTINDRFSVEGSKQGFTIEEAY